METQVLIIGAGVTGTGLARDLALRGITSVVVEKQDVNAGASGGNHGLLHSGARYVATDPLAAKECRFENHLLKKMASHCIEETNGLFVAVAGDDENYLADFVKACKRCNISARPLDIKEAQEMEPSLTNRLIAAFEVDDATIDPFKLSLDNMASARQMGSQLLRYCKVIGFEKEKGRIETVIIQDEPTGQIRKISPEIVVNATGAWAAKMAKMAGAKIEMRYSKGSLLVTKNRIAKKVINRLHKSTDGDILVPGGTVSILGTTSERVITPDVIYPEIHEVDALIDDGAVMVPELAKTRYIRAYCGVRPLLGAGTCEDDRSISRSFALIDHAVQPEKIQNLITITGGKLTTYRLMAEKTADLICRRLGVKASCRTKIDPLPNTVDARWTEPGLAPNMWRKRRAVKDLLLCECEMVSQSVVDDVVKNILAQKGRPNLKTIGLRSRIGKGPCQGTFCSQRVTAYLYDRGYLNTNEGTAELSAFLNERWRGQQPLLWDTPLAQAELLEAMHCGFFGLELDTIKHNLPNE